MRTTLDSRLRTAVGQASVLFMLLSALTISYADNAGKREPAVEIAFVDLTLAVAALLVPWRRWPFNRSLLLLLPAGGVVGASAALGVLPTRGYGVLFVLMFAWIGANHPPRTAIVVLPLLTTAYVVPILVEDTGVPFDPRSVLTTMTAGVLIGDVVAGTLAKSRRAHAQANRTADIFRSVSRSGAAVRALEPTAVLDSIVDAVMALGYDSANIAVLDFDAGVFLPRHARGLATSFEDRPVPLDAGTTGRVVATETPVVAENYPASAQAVPEIAAAGIRTAVAVPVFTHERLTAVLHAATRRPTRIHQDDVDAITLLATFAGAALENAELFHAQRAAAAASADAALTDRLTGLRNRRHAERLLEHLLPGDVVVLADLDHFKSVNDRHGHQGGDDALKAFAGHLRSALRDSDLVCRYGGEEFLIVLPGASLEAATTGVERLMARWRAAEPVTTFSAGIARHVASRQPSDTLAAADAALYAAKRSGRDRACTEADMHDHETFPIDPRRRSSPRPADTNAGASGPRPTR